MGLPYVVDGDVVVTQSNTCALYLGAKLGVDDFGGDLVKATTNHTVLDQTMDLRNDLMKVVYPFGSTKTPEEFPEAFKKHFAKSASATLKKLEGFIGAGPFVLGADPRSGDFMLFEMLDQHVSIACELGEPPALTDYPKLRALHQAMKMRPELQAYFAAPCYRAYAQNNPAYT